MRSGTWIYLEGRYYKCHHSGRERYHMERFELHRKNNNKKRYHWIQVHILALYLTFVKVKGGTGMAQR